MLHSPLEVGPPWAAVNGCDNLRLLSFTQKVRDIDEPRNPFVPFRRSNSVYVCADDLRRRRNVCSFCRHASEKLLCIEQRLRLRIVRENNVYHTAGGSDGRSSFHFSKHGGVW